jgi:hypothetical protein
VVFTWAEIAQGRTLKDGRLGVRAWIKLGHAARIRLSIWPTKPVPVRSGQQKAAPDWLRRLSAPVEFA